MSLDGLGHHLSVGMAGHAGEAGHFLLPRFHQTLQSAGWGLDLCEVVGLAKTMDVDQIHVVCLEPFQACLQASEEFVAGTIGNFCCQPDILAARSHYFAHTSFTLAISVSIGCVQISDAEINGAIEDGRGALFVFVHEEATAAAEGKNRDFCAGSPQSSRRNRIGSRPCVGDVLQQQKTRTGRSSESDVLKKLPAGNFLAHGSS